MPDNSKEIYFHVGLGKTGTTFLQEKVFRHFQGIHYVDTHKYQKVFSIMPQLNEERILVSREFDRQLEKEVSQFSSQYPHATPIIVFRKHSEYIASQYRRFVKNGYAKPFEKFFNLNDTGFFKIKHLSYEEQVGFLRRNFSHEPIVFCYDILRTEPKNYIKNFAGKIGAKVDLDRVDFSKYHSSYNEHQLKVMYQVGQYINLRKTDTGNRLLDTIKKFLMYVPKYGILYFSNLIPKSFTGNKPLIDPAELERVDEYFRTDWEYVRQVTAKRSNAE